MSYNNIIILGGGTAGWSAATLLSVFSKINITVIESPEISTIGVGESTLPAINFIHSQTGSLKFLTKDWLDEVDGTAKFTIEFADFYKKNTKWVHSFLAGYLDKDSFKKIKTKKLFVPTDSTQDKIISDSFLLASYRNKKFYNKFNFSELNVSVPFAYHVDAKKYADLLKSICITKNNVSLKSNTVVGVNLDETTEEIKSLVLDNGEVLTADLFIDCTGFTRLLSNKVNSTWVDNSDRMWCDTALAVQLPYVNPSLQLRNTTYCHALKNGWVWNVPLQTRIGTGYVFSSKYTSIEEAEIEFKQHLVAMYGYNSEDIKPRVVPFKTGYLENPWNKNVVALGLSSSFVEPLESTAIAVAQGQCILLRDLITSPLHNDSQRKIIFNKIHKELIEDIINNIEMHYSLSERTDSQFWIDYSNKPLNEYQKYILSCYLNPEVEITDNLLKTRFKKTNFFEIFSYFSMFLGNGINPDTVTHKKITN